jgi:hypothetical protein
MKIHARFHLGETARVKGSSKVDGEWRSIEMVRTKLYPVQGEPFGSATPNGSIEMVIANPDAAQVFLNAPLGQEFDVVFSLVEKAAETP